MDIVRSFNMLKRILWGVAGIVGLLLVFFVLGAIIAGLDHDEEASEKFLIPGNEYADMTRDEFAERRAGRRNQP